MLSELKALISDLGARMHRGGGRMVEDRRARIVHAERALKRVPDLVELAAQRFNLVSGRLGAALARNAAAHERDLVAVASRFSPLLLQRPQAVQRQRLDGVVARLPPAVTRTLDRATERLSGLSKLYVSVDPDRPLYRGFARVSRADGSLVINGGLLASGEAVSIRFGDRVTRQAVIDGDPAANPTLAKRAARKGKAPPPGQGDLF